MRYRSVFAPGLFAGQVVVLTGGGSGIGRCTAHELAALGAHVVLIGRNADKLRTVQDEITQADVSHVQMDVVSEGRVARCQILMENGQAMPACLGAIVRVTGVYVGRRLPTGEFGDPEIWVASPLAVEVVGRLQPDVVLMDVRMPRKDGLWAAEQIIASGSATKFPARVAFTVPSMATTLKA